MSRPVFLFSEALNGTEPVSHFDLELTLWGRTAIANSAVVENALERMGAAGLQNDGGRVPFSVESLEWSPLRTLRETACALADQRPRRLLIEFPVPFLFVQTETDADGTQRKYIQVGGDLQIEEMLANCAYHLAAWNLEDRFRSGLAVPDPASHGLLSQTRDSAREAAREIRVVRSELRPAYVGPGRSRSNGRRFPQDGFVGLAELGGNLAPAIPWIAGLNCGGGGQHRSDGFGVVRLWVPGDPHRIGGQR